MKQIRVTQNIAAAASFSLFLFGFMAILLISGCSTSPIIPHQNAPIVRAISISPPIIAPGGLALLSIEAFDPDGNSIYVQFGTGEAVLLSGHEKSFVRMPATTGKNEVTVGFSNGRADLFTTVSFEVDPALTTTILSGTTTLPVDKSFDILSGITENAYYGDLDFRGSYGYYYLDFTGNGNGGALPYSYFDGGIVNLTLAASIEELAKVYAPYAGYYLPQLTTSSYDYLDQKIVVGNIYCVWFMRGTTNYFAKIKIASFDSSGLIFDWVVQTDPSKKRFYD